MVEKLVALLSQVQHFGMAPWTHGFNAVNNEEIANHLVKNNVIVQKKEPAPVVFVGRKGYALTTENLPDVIQDLMAERGITQKDLSAKTGLTQNTLRRLVKYRGCVSHFSLECLLDAFGKELVIVDKKESKENGK
jgi:ribosome-binding protein aMBF1 (putative translation factor)